MKALILNSGLGKRLGDYINNSHKSLVMIDNIDTILSRQIRILIKNDINNIIITTGHNANIIKEYCTNNFKDLNIKFIDNKKYDTTNYIYSIYEAREEIKNNDILLMHGDLVFDESIIKDFLYEKHSVMAVSTTSVISEKDFKALIIDGKIKYIGTKKFDNSIAAQPLYKLNKLSLNIWLDKIVDYCENGNINCYAEDAFNEVSEKCDIFPYDIKERLCAEIDDLNDLSRVKEAIQHG